MNAENLKSPFYQFGNKGAVWSNKTHIATSDSPTPTTLCGTPMLSSNWAKIENHPTIGCKQCLKLAETLVDNISNNIVVNYQPKALNKA